MSINTWTGRPWCDSCRRLGCPSGFGHYAFNFGIYYRKKKQRFREWIRSFTDFNYSKITDVEVDGIDHRDAPDFCDAYISSAYYKGREMTEIELERLNEDRDFVYQKVMDRIY